MRVGVIGGGGREAAIAWACRRHGHAVTMAGDIDAVDLGAVDLVIPGPEAALVAGAADRCAAAGVPCFGPTAALARLEASKGYARQLGRRGWGSPARRSPASPPATSSRRPRGGGRSIARSSSSSTDSPPARA